MDEEQNWLQGILGGFRDFTSGAGNVYRNMDPAFAKQYMQSMGQATNIGDAFAAGMLAGAGVELGLPGMGISQAEKDMRASMKEAFQTGDPQAFYNISQQMFEAGDTEGARQYFEMGSQQEYRLGQTAAARAKAKRGSDIGQMNEATRTSIEKQVKDAFKSTGWLPDIGDPENLPAGWSLDSAVEQIFAVSQKENISIPEAIKAFTFEYANAAGVSPTTPAGPPVVQKPTL